MERPHHHGMDYSLATLRAAIDAQDDAILASLTARQLLVDRIRAVKTREGHLVYRPGREAKILRRLFAAADARLNKTLIYQMWREIFSSAILLQEPLTIAVVETPQFSLRELARQSFGHAANLISGNLERVMQRLLSREASLAVVPTTPDAAGAILSAIAADPVVQIIGLFPFLAEGDAAPLAYAIGRVCSEESGDDITLVRAGDRIEQIDGYQLDHPNLLGIVPRPYRAPQA